MLVSSISGASSEFYGKPLLISVLFKSPPREGLDCPNNNNVTITSACKPDISTNEAQGRWSKASNVKY